MRDNRSFDKNKKNKKSSSVHGTNIRIHRSNQNNLDKTVGIQEYQEFAEDETSIYEYDLRCLSCMNRRRKR